MGFGGTTIGDYSNNNFIEVIQSASNNWNIFPSQQGTGGFTFFEVTEFGPNLIGTFSGEMTNIYTDPMTGVTTTEIVNCSGEFNLVQ